MHLDAYTESYLNSNFTLGHLQLVFIELVVILVLSVFVQLQAMFSAESLIHINASPTPQSSAVLLDPKDENSSNV